jgi:putative redox protein
MSIAGCLAIDVVYFLKKMRAEIRDFKIDFEGKRNAQQPQYYNTIQLTVHVSGNSLTAKKVERAIALSQEKYCSVYHSLKRYGN